MLLASCQPSLLDLQKDYSRVCLVDLLFGLFFWNRGGTFLIEPQSCCASIRKLPCGFPNRIQRICWLLCQWSVQSCTIRCGFWISSITIFWPVPEPPFGSMVIPIVTYYYYISCVWCIVIWSSVKVVVASVIYFFLYPIGFPFWLLL